MQKKLRIGNYVLTISGAVDTTGETERELEKWGFSDEQVELQVLCDALGELHYLAQVARIHAKQKHGEDSRAVQRITERRNSIRELMNEVDQIFE